MYALGNCCVEHINMWWLQQGLNQHEISHIQRRLRVLTPYGDTSERGRHSSISRFSLRPWLAGHQYWKFNTKGNWSGFVQRHGLLFDVCIGDCFELARADLGRPWLSPWISRQNQHQLCEKCSTINLYSKKLFCIEACESALVSSKKRATSSTGTLDNLAVSHSIWFENSAAQTTCQTTCPLCTG